MNNIRNDGAFPRDGVRTFVAGTTGRPAPAHLASEMPAWGSIFGALDPSDARVARRVDNLVAYVESLQAASTAPDDPGSQLFRTYCSGD